jgi:probable HAF family extracellular repeat protein
MKRAEFLNRRPGQCLATVAVLWLTAWSAPADAAQPFFIGLGDLAGGTFASSANGVSADGSVVVGSGNSQFGAEAFRWTQAAGMVGLGDLAGGPFSSGANGVSADGSVVVGSSAVATQSSHGGPPFTTLYRAFRWTQSGGMVNLGLLSSANDTTSHGVDIAADGAVAVGWSGVDPVNEAPHGQAFRWNQGGGMIGLGVLPGYDYTDASDVAVNGTVIVGRSWSGAHTFVGAEAFRWKQNTGMIGLGDLPGGQLNSRANGVSEDGSVVVGQGTSAIGSEAFRWTQTAGMFGLGILPGFGASSALDLSADGAIVIGNSSNGSSFFEAFIWDASRGMRSLRDVLVSDFGLGGSLTGWTLRSANAISPDGQFIVGTGTNSTGNGEAWLARLAPTLPGDFNRDGTVDSADYVVWRKGPGTTYTQNDYDFWRAHFGETAGSGSGAGSHLWTNVPEPATVILLLIAGAITIRPRHVNATRSARAYSVPRVCTNHPTVWR